MEDHSSSDLQAPNIEIFWTELWKKLRAITYRNYRWASLKYGLNLEDIISHSILDFLTRTRHHSPVDIESAEDRTKLFKFLCEVIKSDVYHASHKSMREKSVDDYPKNELSPVQNRSNQGIPLACHDVEQQLAYGELSRQLLNAVRSEPLLKTITELWIEAPDLKPEEISEALGLPIEKVRNAQKRLKRRTKKVQKQWKPKTDVE